MEIFDIKYGPNQTTLKSKKGIFSTLFKKDIFYGKLEDIMLIDLWSYKSLTFHNFYEKKDFKHVTARYWKIDLAWCILFFF